MPVHGLRVIADHDVANLLRLVDDVNAVHILLGDVVHGQHAVAQPADEAGPVLTAEEDHREVGDLLGLDQHQRAEELIERAEAAGECHEGLGVLDEHHLAHEEVAELHRPVDVLAPLRAPGRIQLRALPQDLPQRVVHFVVDAEVELARRDLGREDRLVVLDRDAELDEVVDALDAAGGLACRLHRRQQQGNENGDDRDHDQQLDQRKSVTDLTSPHHILQE